MEMSFLASLDSVLGRFRSLLGAEYTMMPGPLDTKGEGKFGVRGVFAGRSEAGMVGTRWAQRPASQAPGLPLPGLAFHPCVADLFSS